VLKAVQAGMSLPAHTLLPSFAALRDYGNTSCSTTWYVIAYMESIGSVYRGQHIMQVRQTRGGSGVVLQAGIVCCAPRFQMTQRGCLSRGTQVRLGNSGMASSCIFYLPCRSAWVVA
jgi:hypothetical protein